MPQTTSPLSSLTPAPDDVLVAAARTGDHDALTILFDRHHRVAASVAARSLSCPADVDDAVAEAYTRVFERLATLRDPARFRAFLLTSVRNVVHDRQRRGDRLVPSGDVGHGQPASGSVEALIEAADEARRLVGAVNGLPPRQRYALRRFFWEEAPVIAIADELGLTANATTQLLFRAKANLATRSGLSCRRTRSRGGNR